MCDADRRAWVAGVASQRGVALEPDEVEAVVAAVTPVLEAFRTMAAELAADDDLYEFRRLLGREAPA
jgi:hypothetical protein